jgi:hypothetical protein
VLRYQPKSMFCFDADKTCCNMEPAKEVTESCILRDASKITSLFLVAIIPRSAMATLKVPKLNLTSS